MKRNTTTKTPIKIDLAKLYKEQYTAPRQPVRLEIPEVAYLSIIGKGAPGGDDFSAKIGALYAVAYTIKMTRKFGGQQDYAVSKLEAQYWSEKRDVCFAELPKEQWCWKLMIRTPEFVTAKELQSAVTALQEKGKSADTAKVVLERFTEGLCVQMLHVGPYDQEGVTYEKMMTFASGQGLVAHGLPHDIYISDPRRVAPEKLKTILRQPVKKP